MILGGFIYLFVGMGVGLGCDIIKDLGNFDVLWMLGILENIHWLLKCTGIPFFITVRNLKKLDYSVWCAVSSLSI